MGQAEELTIEVIKLPAVKALTGLGTTKIYEMASLGHSRGRCLSRVDRRPGSSQRCWLGIERR